MGVLIPLGYMVGIFIMSAIPDTVDTPRLFSLVSSGWQNLLHIPVFGFLAVLWIPKLKSCGIAENRCIWMALMIGIGYGAFTEIFQLWIPGRFPSVTDFIYDIAGIVLFIWLYQQVKFRVGGWRDHKKPAV